MLSSFLKRVFLFVAMTYMACCFSAPAIAESPPVFTTEDGHALQENQAALVIQAGWPHTRIQFIAAPWNYINVGFQLDVDYVPGFTVSAPWKFQLLENKARTVNFALTVKPGFDFSFSETSPDLFAVLHPGFSSGWRFHSGNTFFLASAYKLAMPISEQAQFAHYPVLQTGFEIPLTLRVNLILKGLIAFTDYQPEAFVYGGLAGVSVALWR